ncbi:MAG: Mur ligase family protein, partial [Mycobacteriales bacterium]
MIAAFLAAVGALVLGLPRWLRVAQREHYLPGRASAVLALWLRVAPGAAVAASAALATGVAAVLVNPWWAPGAAALALGLATPVGLAWRARTGRLHWTARVRRLAVLAVLCDAAVAAGLAAVRPGLAALAPLLAAPVLDVALALTGPVERRASRRFVVRAKARLAAVAPRVIAVTGSYGKTTTKEYLRQLLATQWAVAASPGSFNNLLGLSRAVQETVQPGVDIFVAEMGTYGPGEIRELCRV